jgi:uncharacterized membrane protein
VREARRARYDARVADSRKRLVSWLDRSDSRSDRVQTSDVLRLAERRTLAPADVDRALQLAGCVPTAAGWKHVLDRLLLGLAIAFLVSGAICLVAYNWSEMPRWGRLALAQTVLLLVLGLVVWLGPSSVYGRAALVVAIGLIGPLLALFGQTYQTGADLSGLFLGWALLSLPWVFASRAAAAWLLWLAVLETGVFLHIDAFDLWRAGWLPLLPTWAWACGLQLAVLVGWERCARRYEWLAGRLGPRLIATSLLALLTGLVCALVWSEGLRQPQSLPLLQLAPIIWLLVLAAGYFAYRVRGVEMAMLCLGWLSVTIVLLALLVRFLGSGWSNPLALLLAAALLVASSALGRRWLRDVVNGPAQGAGRGDGAGGHDAAAGA